MGGHAGGGRGDHIRGCARMVRPRRVRPVCSSYLKVALKAVYEVREAKLTGMG